MEPAPPTAAGTYPGTPGRYGRIGFYEGETADKLLTGVRAGGGIWSAADLRDYRVIERRPLEVKLANGRELISAPRPSAGGVALAQSLQMLEQLPWQKAEPVQRAHYVLEVLRRAYRDRGCSATRTSSPTRCPVCWRRTT